MTCTALVPYARKKDPHSLTTARAIRLGILTDICHRIMNGDLIADACHHHGVNRVTVWEWARDDEEMGNMYARARSVSATALEEEALGVARTTNAFSAPGDRVLIDTLKWAAAKRRPKVYGDKVDVTTDGQPLQAPQVVTIGKLTVTF